MMRLIKGFNKWQTISGLAAFVMIMTVSTPTQAQDAEFSQFYANPMYLNPGLAGISYGPRLTLNYRNQWPNLGDGLQAGFVTFSAGFDMHVEALSGGIGLLVSSDRIAGDLLVSNSASLAYAYQARFSRSFGVKMGLMGTYSNTYLDWHRLRFSDQIDPITGFTDAFNTPFVTTEVIPTETSLHQFDASFGMVFFSQKHFAGASVKHILRPTHSFYGNDDERLSARLSVHAGSQLDFNKRRPSSRFLAPNVALFVQRNFVQLNGGAILNIENIFGGLYYRHNISNSDAVIALVGVRKGKFQAGYSYDITVSDLRSSSGGSHELSLVINFAVNENSLYPSSMKGIVDCPAILGF